jgi:hypothetical protein
MRATSWPLAVVCVLCLGVCIGRDGSAAAPARGADHVERATAPASVALPRTTFGKHDRVPVEFTTGRATGVVSDTRTSYILAAQAVRPASGCVNNRDRPFPDAASGARVRAALDPARGEGGPEGWCRGRYAGTVTYFSGFACPAEGRCRPPSGFPTGSRVVARFSFRVR